MGEAYANISLRADSYAKDGSSASSQINIGLCMALAKNRSNVLVVTFRFIGGFESSI